MKTFYSVPNWLEVEGRRLPVIVSGRKPACWHCGEIGHLSAVCPGKKAPKKPDHKPGTLSPVVKNNDRKGGSRSLAHTSGIKKTPLSLRPLRLTPTRRRAEWLTVGKGGRKLQPAGSSLPKVVPGGHRQFNPPAQKRPIPTSYPHMPKNQSPPKNKGPLKTPPKQSHSSQGQVFQPRPGEVREAARIQEAAGPAEEIDPSTRTLSIHPFITQTAQNN